MKVSIPPIIVSCVLLFLSGCSFNTRERISSDTNVPWITTETIGDFVVRQLHGAQLKTVSSGRFNIQFSLPTTWRVEQGESSSTVVTLIFQRKNEDTDENSRRDTPNGFNTAVQDNGGLDIYSNRENVRIETPQIFQQWHDAAVAGRQIEKMQQQTVGHLTLFYAQESDGVQSTGQYYYFATPSYIFVFGTDDIPDADMTAIFRSLTMGT